MFKFKNEGVYPNLGEMTNLDFNFFSDRTVQLRIKTDEEKKTRSVGKHAFLPYLDVLLDIAKVTKATTRSKHVGIVKYTWVRIRGFWLLGATCGVCIWV